MYPEEKDRQKKWYRFFPEYCSDFLKDEGERPYKGSENRKYYSFKRNEKFQVPERLVENHEVVEILSDEDVWNLGKLYYRGLRSVNRGGSMRIHRTKKTTGDGAFDIGGLAMLENFSGIPFSEKTNDVSENVDDTFKEGLSGMNEDKNADEYFGVFGDVVKQRLRSTITELIEKENAQLVRRIAALEGTYKEAMDSLAGEIDNLNNALIQLNSRIDRYKKEMEENRLGIDTDVSFVKRLLGLRELNNSQIASGEGSDTLAQEMGEYISELLQMCEITVIKPSNGDRYDGSIHFTKGWIDTNNSELDRCIATVVKNGLRLGKAGGVIEPATVTVYQYKNS